MEYQPTIGLEIHAELKTKTKMFCRCFNDPDEKNPNINVCPVCMGHPGTLPVINEEAVKKVLLTGRALNGKLADYSRFDRKNYFYPDLPKGYQISQYKYPLVRQGELELKIKNSKLKIKIQRIHLEEDAGRLVHGQDGSYVDFNRAGLPLLELVTEPDIKSGEEAKKFAQELQLILRYLDVSDADMEKGQMRVEANISLQTTYDVVCSTDIVSRLLGTKVEIKNLNSFRALQKAINYEIKRQTELLEAGKEIIQETRGWDGNKEITFSQREKEESHDYRYFPEPDLPSLDLKKLSFHLETKFPSIELPQQKRERFKKEFKLKDEQIEILINDKNLADYFKAIADGLKEESMIQLAANYLISDLLGLMKEKSVSLNNLKINHHNFAKLITMAGDKKISSRVAKDVLKIIFDTGEDPYIVIEREGLKQKVDESEIKNLAEEIIRENPAIVEDYKKGKETALQALIGRAMKETKGSINPEIFAKILKECIMKEYENSN